MSRVFNITVKFAQDGKNLMYQGVIVVEKDGKLRGFCNATYDDYDRVGPNAIWYLSGVLLESSIAFFKMSNDKSWHPQMFIDRDTCNVGSGRWTEWNGYRFVSKGNADVYISNSNDEEEKINKIYETLDASIEWNKLISKQYDDCIKAMRE